jgi:clan AA aspartic protease
VNGEVTYLDEARVVLEVRGPAARAAHVETVLDTGFTEDLSVDRETAARLGLPFDSSMDVVLADGSIESVDVHTGTVVWHGRETPVHILVSDGDPLLGMHLLYGSRLTIDVVDGGAVTIEPLP